jgi:hypothetical protein
MAYSTATSQTCSLFAANLRDQMAQCTYQSPFQIIEKELGKDVVDCIPVVTIGDWQNPTDLPADVVKGICAESKRPFLYIRYLDTKINKVVVNFLFQKYSNERPPLALHLAYRFAFITEFALHGYDEEAIVERATSALRFALQSEEDLRLLPHNWPSHWAIHSSHSNSCIDSFEMIRGLVNGASLETTNGRYLPMYAKQFTQEENLMSDDVS